jgi:hypothetical protein
MKSKMSRRKKMISILDYCVKLWDSAFFSVSTSRTRVSKIMQEARDAARNITGDDILIFDRNECRNTYDVSLVLRRWRRTISALDFRRASRHDEDKLIDSLRRLRAFMLRYKNSSSGVTKTEMICLAILAAMALYYCFFIKMNATSTKHDVRSNDTF